MNEHLANFLGERGNMDTFMLVTSGVALDARESEATCLKRRLRELATELVEALEATRQHLARELHDAVGAELTAARFALANLENTLSGSADERTATALDIAQRSLGSACEASRSIVDAFHTPALDGDIVATLAQWTRSFSRRTGLAVSLACDADMRFAQLPPQAALAIFRVAQEALGNVAKHAGASRAEVRLNADALNLTLTVTDDGRGLAHSARSRTVAAGTPSRGFGLAGMRARCEAFDGTLNVRLNDAHADSPSGSTAGSTVQANFAWRALLATRDETASREGRSPRRSGKEVSQ
jgi:two-component system, NarL family, sensor histidine kinase UhpB